MNVPLLLLVAGVGCLSIKTLFTLPIIGNKIILSDLFFILSAMTADRNKDYFVRLKEIKPIVLLLASFLCWLVLSSFFSVDAFLHNKKAMLEIGSLAYDAAIFILFYLLLDSPRKLFLVLIAWFFAMVLADLIAGYAILSGATWGFSRGALIGSFAGANQPQIVLVPLLAALFFVVSARRAALVVRGSAFLVVVSSFSFMLISGSRSALVMVLIQIVGSVLICLLTRQYRNFISNSLLWGQSFFYVCLIALFLVAGPSWAQKNKVFSGLQRVAESVELVRHHTEDNYDSAFYDRLSTGRVAIIKAAIPLFKESPLIGFGLQQTRNMEEIHHTEIHCLYLVMLFETGIIGFLLFSFFLFAVIRKTYFKLIGLPFSYDRLLFHALLLGGVAMGAYNMVTNGSRQRELWILLGIITAYSSFSNCALLFADSENTNSN
ncbi:O-antigen ligase family protein [Halodesulfovibrio aestuarii]|uniref:O-antigen ligase like membrane protein n=1 Tax=Halodesulfovibrio aestuarii TaxID=126333 RepID=A0A8G2FBA8_9BACT|nr:O-antigen ligase family protein [Halodesulfovibrio aestuarii]SHJ29084.1 O-antigen ligase like membrane protein [Halodesulfovibrio aestuarii]